MRYDTVITLLRFRPREYDPATGNYKTLPPEERKLNASVMDTGAETLRLVYGKIRQGSLTIHTQNHVEAPFDRIRIKDKTYAVDLARKLRRKSVFVVSEV